MHRAMKPSPASLRRLLPFLLWWPRVTRGALRADLLAGLSGALIVLPQGVAFATIAGLPPQYGLYAAMAPAVIAALFGSSWHLVSGPTTAISIAVFAALSHQALPGSAEYIRLALTLTFLVGMFQLALGLARMGALVNFISHSVVIGFTAGAAILIAASQVRSFFGIDIPRGTPFYEIARLLVVRAGDINPWAAGVGLVTLAAGLLSRRYLKRVPYMIVAMLVGSLVAEALVLWRGAAAGIVTVGALPAQLPPLSLPDFSLDALRVTLGPALVITMLALTEAVSIARAIAVRSEQRIDGNQEFIGQGVSNIVGAFFSAYASSGSFNRSGVNYEAGARTPLASVFASFFLLAVLLAVAPLAAYLPTAAMAGILFLVAWGLIDFHHIRHIWHTSKAETAILFATLIGTLFNLEAGIFLGITLSLMLYLHRTSRPEIVPLVPAAQAGAYHFVRAQGHPLLALSWRHARIGTHWKVIGRRFAWVAAAAFVCLLPWHLEAWAACRDFNRLEPQVPPATAQAQAAIESQLAFLSWEDGARELGDRLPAFSRRTMKTFVAATVAMRGGTRVTANDFAILDQAFGWRPEPISEHPLLALYGGLNFYLANPGDGEGGFSRAALEAPPPLEGGIGRYPAMLVGGLPPNDLALSYPPHLAAVNHGYALGLAWLRDHLGAVPGLLFAKARIFWSGAAPGLGGFNAPLGLSGERRRVDLTVAQGPLASAWRLLILAFFLLGLWSCRRRVEALPFALLFLNQAVASLAFFGYARLGALALPAVAAFVAGGVAALPWPARFTAAPRILRGALVVGALLLLSEAIRTAHGEVPYLDGRSTAQGDPYNPDLHENRQLEMR